MKVDAKIPTFQEFQVIAEQSVAGLEKVPGVHEKVERYQVATEKTLEDLKSVFVNPEVRRTWKWLMEVKADVGLFELLFQVERHHDELAVVNPDSLAPDLMPDFDDLLRYSLIHVVKGAPVLKILVPHVVEILEVVKQWPQYIFEEQGVRSGLLCRHEDGV